MERRSVKIIKASKSLQAKAGTGDIPPPVVDRAEQVLADNNEDFQPMAEAFLARLLGGINHAKNNIDKEPKALLISGMTKPVMELKANAKMFKYDLVTNLANIMLDFLETIGDLNPSAIEIVAAHHKTLTLIVTRKMSGSGGEMGPVLQKELTNACARYFAQKKKA